MADTNPTVVFTQPKTAVIEDREIPSPGPGQLLVRTGRTLISTGTELTIFAGDFAPGSAWAEYAVFPFVPGYSNVGEVVEIGANVDRSWIGRRVANAGPHARFVLVPAGPAAQQARPLHRPEVSDDEAAFFCLAEVVMNGLRRSRLAWGESAVVYGCGLLGQLAVRFARLLGARPVLAIDMADTRLQLLPTDPGIIPVNPRRQNVADIVREATRGRLADVVIELTGNPSLIPDEFDCVRNQGRLLMLSSPAGATTFDFHDLCNARSITIIGAHVGSHPDLGEIDLPWTRQRHCELFFDLIADRDIDLQTLITHRAPYTDAPTWYHQLLADRSQLMGVVLQWPD